MAVRKKIHGTKREEIKTAKELQNEGKKRRQ
jgi:hypothetical protein